LKKTVLITGCSSGLGRASALTFVNNGWNVVATMRAPNDDREFRDNENILVTRLDVQDQASIGEAIQAGIARFGRIDALVNNAGFGLFGIFEGTPREKIQEQFDVNVFGVMDVTRAMLPHFRENMAGRIVNVSSGAGVFTLPMLSLYCASKFALEGFSEALSYELLSQNIIVKVVEPGGVVSTNFGARSGSEAARATSVPDYDAFVAGVSQVFGSLRDVATATEMDVANVIFRAATDDTDQFRYVATDDIAPMVTARRESSESDYIAFMRSRFMPKLSRQA
jgi:NAD(P)-dependent dehydrogenase (short-subunit alcohol dehydrogenase family)